MAKTVLVTGGAGFIGSHITDHLIQHGYDVIVYDNLDDQVHDGMPDYANPGAEYVIADLRDREQLVSVVERADIVCHQAGAVGVGQSAYEIESFVDVNSRGTATLLDCLVQSSTRIEKLVLASSMTVYGEGAYECQDCEARRYPSVRPRRQLEERRWEPQCPACGVSLDPCPIAETKPKDPTSVYGVTKHNQEELCFTVGAAHDIPTVALRYFGVYGERQSLSNPYTGVCAVFTSRVLNGNPPIVFEDGAQLRDFVHVSDVARANRLAIEATGIDQSAFNIGTGYPTSILEVATTLIDRLDRNLDPEVLERSRIGDIRHGYAEIHKAREGLGFEPSVSFETGMDQLTRWCQDQPAIDSFSNAIEELEDHTVFVPSSEDSI